MPTLTQRRNAAFLNRGISRFGTVDREPDDQEPLPRPDLHWSRELGRVGFPTCDVGAAYLDEPPR